jgi:hypothetical protein
MRGQKRVEDARERAYDPRIQLLRKNILRNRWIAGSSPAMTAKSFSWTQIKMAGNGPSLA